jgi:RimJ/RimL family protein N-acetyltransferase
MPLTLHQLADASLIADPELRQRATNTPYGGYSHLYVLRHGPIEAGFLVLDEGDLELEFYSLWIAKRFRGRGYGRAALGLVLAHALERSYSSIVLRPVPLDDDWDETRLRRLYGRAGYSEDPDDPSLMRLTIEGESP